MSAAQQEAVSLPSVSSMKEHVEVHEMEINMLNDDCLMHIIEYLPVADRVRIERGIGANVKMTTSEVTFDLTLDCFSF